MRPPPVALPPSAPNLLGHWVLMLLSGLAVALAIGAYFAGPGATFPESLPAQLLPVPLTLETFSVGDLAVPMPVSGFIVSLTHDVGGPLVHPVAAGILLFFLALAITGWLDVVSTLARAPFAVGMVPVVFLLMSLQADALGVFAVGEQYFFYLLLVVLGGTAFGLHAFGARVPLLVRWLIFGLLLAGLGSLLFARSDYSAADTALQLAAYATPAGAVLFGLLVLWAGFENVRVLLWFNGQAPLTAGRFGLLPFLLATGLYLTALAAYVWNGELRLWPTLALDPLLLLLPAVLAGGLGLRLRAPSYQSWVPFGAARQLYPLLIMGAATALGYALLTQNSPLLDAARAYAALLLLLAGAAFLGYVLLNFLPLIRQRLQVFRVVFAPRRVPFYAVYLLVAGAFVAVQVRRGNPLPSQVQAGQFNHLGDLSRAQSETRPDDLGLALLAERYYAESGDVLDRHNAHAQLGRAALYRFRQQRQNEVIALRRALQRRPDAQISLRLAGLFNEPQDLFEALDVLRQARRDHPRNAALAADLAQRFTQSSLADSVAFYLDRAEALAPGAYPNRSNQLAFLLRQRLYEAAAKRTAPAKIELTEPALLANLTLLRLLQNAAADSVARQKQPGSPASAAGSPATASPPAAPGIVNLTAFTAADFAPVAPDLDAATFAALYHAALANARRADAALLPLLVRLSQRPANEPYYEQLVFLQALTRHAAGQEMAARQTLAPLTAGSSTTARYYQYLLGLWQLQQGQYATAAAQLTLAASPDSTLRLAVQRLARQAAAGTAPLPAHLPVGAAWLTQARAASRPERAAALYRRIVQEAPFNETAILAAADFHTRRRDYTAAYEALNTGLTENPASPALLRAYVLAATDAGLPAYATQTLPRLQPLLAPTDFTALQRELAARQAAHAAAMAGFE